jgi:hypothetical protein
MPGSPGTVASFTCLALDVTEFTVFVTVFVTFWVADFTALVASWTSWPVAETESAPIFWMLF